MKALSTKCLTTARALRYPTYKCLAMQRMLVPALGSLMMGAGNLHSLGLVALLK